MNIELIVDQIDAEIEKLKRVRVILEELWVPRSRPVAKPESKKTPMKRFSQLEVRPEFEDRPEPGLIVLPPKQRRDYTRRAKPSFVEPKALAAPVSSFPVFVPNASVRRVQAPKAASDTNALEAVIRRNLLGGAA